METKKKMLKCLKEKNSEELAKLLEQEGFELDIDPLKALAPHVQRLKEFYDDGAEIRSRVTGHNLNTMQFWYEDLNNHVQTYLNGFVKQRKSNGSVETVGYGIVDKIFDVSKIDEYRESEGSVFLELFDPTHIPNPREPKWIKVKKKKDVPLFGLETKLKHPRHFFWYDVDEPKYSLENIEENYDKLNKETLELHTKLKNMLRSGEISKTKSLFLGLSHAIKEAQKVFYMNLKSYGVGTNGKDLCETLKVNSFYAPGNPAEHYIRGLGRPPLGLALPLGIGASAIGGGFAYTLFNSDHPILATAVAGITYLIAVRPTIKTMEEISDKYNYGNIRTSDRISVYDGVEERPSRTGWYGRKAVGRLLANKS